MGAFAWELTEETLNLLLGALQGGEGGDNYQRRPSWLPFGPFERGCRFCAHLSHCFGCCLSHCFVDPKTTQSRPSCPRSRFRPPAPTAGMGGGRGHAVFTKKQRAVPESAASERRRNTLKRLKDVYLKAKAEAGLDCLMCAIFISVTWP